MGKTCKVSYWCKIKKKSVWKAVNTKNFDDDESKAKAFLKEWKETEKAKMEEEYNKLIQKGAIEQTPDKPDEAPICEEIDNKPIEELKQEDKIIDDKAININYTRFQLKIAPKEEGGTSTIIFGSSKSGKTYQLMEILNKYYDNNKFIVFLFADSVFNSPAYKNLPKSIIKLDHFDEDLIKQIHHIQKQTNNKYRFLFVMDDIILEKNNTMILRLILTMRNADISTIMLLQSTTLLSKNGRFNINNAIFRRNNNAESVEQTIRFFLGGYEPFYSLKKMEDKINLYRDITKEYGFIYLDALNDELTFHKGK
jgi:hypothetical protein